jgi:tetratricopeptide (TPR) repeat protein
MNSKKLAAKVTPKKKAGNKAAIPLGDEAIEAALGELVSMMFGEQPSAEDLKALRYSLEQASANADLVGVDDWDADEKFEAQELAFAATEARSEFAARKLAKQALKLDPDCVDALLVLADMGGRTQKARIEALKGAVAAGRRSLGARFFKKNKGHFWMLIDTRPFMRAMETLAGELAPVDKHGAIAIYAEMLELNPGDNQGVRYPLLGLYLAAGDRVSAQNLLMGHREDASAVFAWGLLIERLMAGDLKHAESALQRAIGLNRFVALQLTGRQPLPKGLPDMYELGSVEEAVLCQYYLMPAWEAHPQALTWVFDRCTEMGMGPVPSKGALKKMKTGGGVQ